jgi:hypothetical protein
LVDMTDAINPSRPGDPASPRVAPGRLTTSMPRPETEVKRARARLRAIDGAA